MLEIIYKETRAVKGTKTRSAVPSYRYVYGFIQKGIDNRPALSLVHKAKAVLSEPHGVYGTLEICGAMTTIREYIHGEKTPDSKLITGNALVRTIQNCGPVKLSKGEKAYLLNAMRVSKEETGVDSLELAKVA